MPGIGLVVIRDFALSAAQHLGVADTGSGSPVTPETQFQAASISKVICAVAVLKLAQDGLFGLDDDVNTILKSWQIPTCAFTKTRKITPRMLLSHTAGLGDGFGFPGYEPKQSMPTTVQIVTGVPPSNTGPVLVEHEPFTQMKYSGGGTMILQLALEDVTGLGFAEIAKALILDPLQMSRSSFVWPVPGGAVSRAHDEGAVARSIPWRVYPESAAAGLWTTPTDLAKLLCEVLKAAGGDGSNVIDRSIASAMITPVGIGNYGLGFEINNAFFGHGGCNWGFTCNMHGNAQTGCGVIIMTNSWGRGCRDLLQRVSEAVSAILSS